MFKFVLIASVIACAFGASFPMGMVPQLDGRIVGGESVSINQYPYQISLQKSNSHICGGSLIKADAILTAAHCVYGGTASSYRIRAGSSYWNKDGQTVQVASIKVHEKYNSNKNSYDVAVLKLSSPVVIDDKNVKLIALASEEPADGADAVVTGWGTKTYGASTIPDTLQAVDVQMISVKTCASDYKYYSLELSSTMICAAAKGKDACQGDSGGPLVSGKDQVGVVSWGYGCASEQYPGVYANVAELKDWIEEAAK